MIPVVQIRKALIAGSFLVLTIFVIIITKTHRSVQYRGRYVTDAASAKLAGKSVKPAVPPPQDRLIKFTYKTSLGDDDKQGQPMEVSTKYLRLMGYPIKSYVSPAPETWSDFVFATVIGRFNFAECLGLIGAIQHHFPKRKLLVYKMKLKLKQEMKIKAVCQVEFRDLHFGKFPAHVKKTTVSAYKAVVIQDALRDHSGVFWIDSSVRPLIGEEGLLPVAKTLSASGGVAYFLSASHSVYGVTRPGVYNYLPANQEKLKDLQMTSSGGFLIFKTETIYNNIFKWYLACSLVAKCISPKPIGPVCTIQLLKQSPTEYKYKHYTGCHEYDQSVLGILLANNYDYDKSKYLYSDRPILVRRKDAPKTYSLKFC